MGAFVLHVLLIYRVISLALGVTTSTTPSPSILPVSHHPQDKLENSVITSMLKIVDAKFDTISSRITQMERALNGLQFYSIRQFRTITNSIQNSAVLNQVIHSKLVSNGVETRILQTSVNRMGHNVMALKESNSKTFQQIDRSILYINRNIEDKANEIRADIEGFDSSGSSDHEEVAALLAEAEAERAFSQKRETVCNCTVDMKSLETRIDLTFSALQKQSNYQYDKLKNQSEVHFTKLKLQAQNYFQNVRLKTDSQFEKLKHQNALQYYRLQNETRGQYDTLKRQSAVHYDRLVNHTTHSSRVSEEVFTREETHTKQKEVFIDNEHLFLAISNMTSHIVESVSFIRHTDSMLESIIANTETLADEQEQLRKDVVDAVSKKDVHVPSNQVPNSILDDGTNIVNEGGHLRENVANSCGCRVSETVILDIAKFSKNGSQLFEILTDLAQMSQVSLSSSLVELQDELLRMEETRNKLDSETKLPVSHAAVDYNLVLQKIFNTSKATLKMAEAMASNTGWIPYIFHNMQYVEGQLNRSMSLTTRFLSELRGLKATMSKPHPNSQAQDNVVNKVAPAGDGERRLRSNMSQDDVLDVIYDTSRRLKRIMPALTRLIAEPEPLITLVDGKQANEGRVEIYHKGQWGNICDSKLGHAEASAICRHLGYVGGISATRGQFGPGSSSGASWAMNLTCLRTFQCPVITAQSETNTCNHDADFAVICDHMLRLVALEGSNDVNTGLVEIYQNSKWRPICAHGYGRNEAHVSCRQMGYRDGWNRDARGRTRKDGSIWMTNVQCRGNENTLHACRHNVFGERACPALIPASVTCD